MCVRAFLHVTTNFFIYFCRIKRPYFRHKQITVGHCVISAYIFLQWLESRNVRVEHQV